jgi:hypothetical protein
MWQENLLNNLIVIFVLLALAIIAYCKIRNKTLLDVIKEVREGFNGE